MSKKNSQSHWHSLPLGTLSEIQPKEYRHNGYNWSFSFPQTPCSSHHGDGLKYPIGWNGTFRTEGGRSALAVRGRGQASTRATRRPSWTGWARTEPSQTSKRRVISGERVRRGVTAGLRRSSGVRRAEPGPLRGTDVKRRLRDPRGLKAPPRPQSARRSSRPAPRPSPYPSAGRSSGPAPRPSPYPSAGRSSRPAPRPSPYPSAGSSWSRRGPGVSCFRRAHPHTWLLMLR